MCDNYDLDKCSSCLTKNGCRLKPYGIGRHLFAILLTIGVVILGTFLLGQT